MCSVPFQQIFKHENIQLDTDVFDFQEIEVGQTFLCLDFFILNLSSQDSNLFVVRNYKWWSFEIGTFVMKSAYHFTLKNYVFLNYGS